MQTAKTAAPLEIQIWPIDRLVGGRGQELPLAFEPRCLDRLIAVPNSKDCFDVLGCVRPQFSPQSANVHVQGACPDPGAVAPNQSQQSLAGNDLPGALHQQCQHTILLESQSEHPAIQHCLMLVKI